MGVSDPGTTSKKLELAVVREIVKSYTYVVIWMSISIAVILFNKVSIMWPQAGSRQQAQQPWHMYDPHPCLPAVAPGIQWLPLPYRLDAMAHGLLLLCGLCSSSCAGLGEVT